MIPSVYSPLYLLRGIFLSHHIGRDLFGVQEVDIPFWNKFSLSAFWRYIYYDLLWLVLPRRMHTHGACERQLVNCKSVNGNHIIYAGVSFICVTGRPVL
jgi:hypothetical protein